MVATGVEAVATAEAQMQSGHFRSTRKLCLAG
jgi:hypothetical protein